MSYSGTITIRPLAANLQHDVDLFGKMDPYCLVTLGTQQWKSMICKNGSKTPTWNDEVTFQLQPGVDIMRIALYDDTLIGSDKLIAEGIVPIEKLLNFSSPFEEKIPLTYKAKPCGFIQLRLFVNQSGSMLGQQQNLGTGEAFYGQQQNLQTGLGQQYGTTGLGQQYGTTGLGQQIGTTANVAQEYVQQTNVPLQQPQVPLADPQSLTSQSVQFGPNLMRNKSPGSSPSPKKNIGFAQPQTFVSGQQQQTSSSVPGMQAYVTMPQCCINAVQQHHPGFVPGTTGYTGDIPHHHHHVL